MPTFIYTAKSQPLQTIRGQILAESIPDAIQKLSRQGIFALSVEPESMALAKHVRFGLGKFSSKDIYVFTSELSDLVESGVNLMNGLVLLSGQTANRYLRAVILDLIDKVRDGKSLSEGLSAHKEIFSGLYIAIVRAGEAGGHVDQALKRLAEFLEKEEEFKNSLRSALTYPVFVVVISIATVVFLLTFVIPRFAGMFSDMGQDLPVPTRILMSTSGFFHDYWWLFIIFLSGAILVWSRFIKTDLGKFWWDSLILSLPLYRDIVLKTEIARLMRTFSLLLANGVTVVSALEIATAVVNNAVIKKELVQFRNQIAAGASLSDCLGDSPVFPGFVTNIVSVGEETGTLEKSLMRIAVGYEKDVDRAVKAFTRLLEPVIILAVGVVVGFIVVSMLLPIFQINLMVK